MRVAVIIVNWNGKRDTLQCLQSLSKESYRNKEIIVVDNGSTDGSVKAIQDIYPECSVIPEPENIGFAAGNNKGIKQALDRGADAVLLLNNDTTVAANLISSFLSTASVYPSSILGAKIYQMHHPSKLDHLGGNWNNATGNFDLIGKGESSLYYTVSIAMDYVCGCAMFIPSSIFHRVGLLDPDYFLYWEDSDFCFRAKRLGYLTRLCPEAKVWHIGSSSMTTHSIQTIYFWWRNRLRWIDKNLTRSEKIRVWRKILCKEILRTYKLYALHGIQWALYRKYQEKSDAYATRRHRLLHYSFACRGIYHYFVGKF